MRQNIKFSNLSALIVAKRQELDQLTPQCRCLTSLEALAGVMVLVFLLGAVFGVWMGQNW
jgi:hypothetical protein